MAVQTVFFIFSLFMYNPRMSMSISRFFEALGAPLRNIRQSWGAVHQVHNSVYLRVWQEDRKILEDKPVVRLLLPPGKHGGSTRAHGYTQRSRHIRRIQSGCKCYCVVAYGRDAGGIQGYDSNRLLIGGAILKDKEDTYWLQIIGEQRDPLSEVADLRYYST